VFSDVLLNAFYERGGDLTMYHGLNLFSDHGPDGLLNNGLQVDNTRAGIGEGLVGVLLNHADLRGINLTMYDGLYLNNLLRTGSLYNHGWVDVSHDVGLGLELSALTESTLAKSALAESTLVEPTLVQAALLVSGVVTKELVVVVEVGSGVGRSELLVL